MAAMAAALAAVAAVVAAIAGQARDQSKGQRSNSGARFLCEQHSTLVSLHTPATPREGDVQENDLSSTPARYSLVIILRLIRFWNCPEIELMYCM